MPEYYDESVFEKVVADKIEEVPRLGAGLKIVEFTGDLVRAITLEQAHEDWKRIFFKELPKDARIVKNFPNILLQGISMQGCYCDTRVMVLSSREWPRVEDYATIPALPLTISHDYLKFGKPPYKWYWRLYIWGAEKAVRWFPKWVRY